MAKRYIENTVDPRGYTNARVQTADFGQAGEMIGRAAIGAGEALGRVAANLDEIAAKHDEAAVRNADAEDALRISEIKQRALSAKGMDAQSAIEAANKEIEEVGRTRQSSFSTSRQREMYSNVFMRRRLGVQEAFGSHAVEQTEVARKASLGATIESGVTVAIDNHDDPAEFERNIAAVDEAVAELNKGMPGNAVAGAQRKIRSNVHAGVVEKLLSDPDRATDAAIYLKDHAAEIEPDDETKLWKAVNPIIDEERTLSDASWAMSGAPLPDGSEIDIPEDPAQDPLAALPPEQKIATAAPAPTKGFVNPLGRGVGRISNTATQHRARGSDNAVDIAAPLGTPIRPPMSGKVIHNGWSDKGGWQVLVEHPNGYVTGYAHMKAQSALKVGDPVDNTTILGGVGSTGKSTGPHLHYTVRKAGVKVDPAEVAWTDKGTVAPGKVNWKEDKLAVYDAEDVNIESALGRLHQRASAENWSARRYEKAATEIRQRGAIQQGLYNQNQQRVLDNAAAALAASELDGKPFTTRAQVPGYSNLDDAGKARVDNMLAANKKALAEGGVKANGETYTTLAVAAVDPSTRAEFIRTNLDLIPDITPAERTRLKLKQAQLRNDETGVLAADIDRLHTATNRYAVEAGFGEPAKRGSDKDIANRRKKALLVDRTTALVDKRQKELQRPLTDTEIDGIVRSQIVAITRVSDGEKTTAPLYEIRTMPRKPGDVDQLNVDTTYAEIPSVAKNSIIAALQRRGIQPTPQKVIEAYLEGSR
jgi:murein DD-endopeptidase MepM/ murein hydrolase activator NlpD